MKKKLQLILLDSDKPQESGLFTDENFYSDIPLVRLDKLEGENFKPKHLYAGSDEEIKQGDYFVNIFADMVFKAKETSINAVLVDKFAFKKEDCKKIAITTDDLRISRINYQNNWIPKFTNEFLDLYVKAYNEGEMIQEVEVEYENFRCRVCNNNSVKISKALINIHDIQTSDYSKEFIDKFIYCYKCSNCGHSWIPKLGVNPNNTVDVKVVSNKTYTVSEVVEILYKYEKDNLYFGRDPYYNNVDIIHEWIKKNLK